MKTVDVLRAMREIIENGWCQGAHARSSSGVSVRPESSYGESYCLTGAALRVTNDFEDRLPAYMAIRSVIGGVDITTFNDAYGRTKGQVIAAIDSAIEGCK